MPYMPLMISCWAAADPAMAMKPNAKNPARSFRFIRSLFSIERNEAAAGPAPDRRKGRCLGRRREVLEERLHRVLDLPAVGSGSRNLILGGAAPDHLVSLRV